jgi:phosphinothricin acetyltransferase
LRRLGYCQVFAGISLPNGESIGLHEALGFMPIGVYRPVRYKFRQWRDVGWWQMPLQQPERPEAPAAFRH